MIYCRMAAEIELYFGVIRGQTTGLSGSADFLVVILLSFNKSL